MSPDHPANPDNPVQPHRIRLPAPWRATRLPGTGAAATTPAPGSSAVFRRSFQRPTGLASQSSVALEVTLLEPLSINVTLNGTACSAVRRSDLAFEVPLSADQLRPVNELEITVQMPATATVAGTEQPVFGENYIAQVALVLH